MNEFDGVFDSQDMRVVLIVEPIDHGRQRGGLARSGRACNQHQTTRDIDDFLEHLRGTQVVEGQHLGRNGAEDGRCSTLLVERIDAKAGNPLDLKGEVNL